jgi:hypothetical protein
MSFRALQYIETSQEERKTGQRNSTQRRQGWGATLPYSVDPGLKSQYGHQLSREC